MGMPRFKNLIESRHWGDIRDAWLNHVPVFPTAGAAPDPGLERLEPLQRVSIQDQRERMLDVPGIRTNLLWEAVFLFHKCAHAHLASQRLGHKGMHSWSMFSAYHSAYLGARGVMALLGLGLPKCGDGAQLLVDVYPPPTTKREQKALERGAYRFEEFVVYRLPRLDQQDVWDAFLRTLRVSDVEVWDSTLRSELTDLNYNDITRPRNAILYKAAHWPAADLVADGASTDFDLFFSDPLSPDDRGFLLRLSCNVYRIFEELIGDLAALSGPIKLQLDESRIYHSPQADELSHYNTFLAGLNRAVS